MRLSLSLPIVPCARAHRVKDARPPQFCPTHPSGAPNKIGSPTRRQAGRLTAIPDPVRPGMSRLSCLQET